MNTQVKNKHVTDKAMSIGRNYLTSLSDHPGAATWPLLLGMNKSGEIVSAAVFPNPDSVADLSVAMDNVQLLKPDFISLIVMAEITQSAFGNSAPVLTVFTFDMGSWHFAETMNIIFTGGQVIYDPSEYASIESSTLTEIAVTGRNRQLSMGPDSRELARSMHEDASRYAGRNEVVDKLLSFRGTAHEELIAGFLMRTQIYGLANSPQDNAAFAAMLPEALAKHIGMKETNQLMITSSSLSRLVDMLTKVIFF